MSRSRGCVKYFGSMVGWAVGSAELMCTDPRDRLRVEQAAMASHMPGSSLGKTLDGIETFVASAPVWRVTTWQTASLGSRSWRARRALRPAGSDSGCLVA
jgi:hypothetical protein